MDTNLWDDFELLVEVQFVLCQESEMEQDASHRQGHIFRIDIVNQTVSKLSKNRILITRLSKYFPLSRVIETKR